jgi:diamine N-acetyltransferase
MEVFDMSKLNNYVDSSGKIKVWPSKRDVKLEVLKHLVKKIEYNRFYNEKEINKIIDDFHSFNDYFLLRRELVNNSLLIRTRSGSRYWRGDIYPTSELTTQRLKLSDCNVEDKGKLNAVYISCSNMEEWSGSKHDPEFIDKAISEGNLPPEGNLEFYRLIAAIDKETNSTVGLTEYYLGYPDNKTLWIGSLYIHKDYQRKGYGSEFFNLIHEFAKAAGFERIGIGVYLKNWQALRFWVKNGFNKINGIYGDEIYSTNTYSKIALIKENLQEEI